MASDGILFNLFEFEELSRTLGAKLFSYADSSVTGFSSVSVDSRTLEEGALFVALPGSAHDGHSFVETAFEKGAAAALVDSNKIEAFGLTDIAKKYCKNLITVDDPLKGLQSAARIYLEKFPSLLKIGITGSSGKTTTKEIAAAIIGVEKCIVMNPGNYNSEIGLPLAVFAVRPCHEVGIFEMGMNHEGEMKTLARVLNPNIALITNIGSAHIGILGSKEAIAKEKKEIFSQFNGNGVALIPDESSFRDFLAEGVRGKVSFFGLYSFPEFGGAQNKGLEGSEVLWAQRQLRFPLPGRYNLFDALAAIAIAKEIPVGNEAIWQGLESVKPLFGRSEILYGRATVIQDCYNANPESLEEALRFCDDLNWQGRRIYVIGEMLELGDKSGPAHADMGHILARSKADKVYLYGKETLTAAATLEVTAVRFFHTCDMDETYRGYFKGSGCG